MKKIFFIILISFLFLGKINAEINDSLFMTIGNKPITKSDLVNEIKIILILNNESYSAEKREKLHEVAVKSTIKRNIKQIELERHNFYKFSEEDFQNELNRLAGNLFMDIETLKNICSSNEVDFSIIEEQIKVELYWNSLIFELYKNRLKINKDEIEDKLKLIQNKKKVQEYLISEIVIKRSEEENLDFKIQEIKNKIETEGFEKVARDISISESSLKGGDLGWLNENIVSNKVKELLLKTKVNELSDPIILPEGILLFKVRDQRQIDTNLSLEEMKNQLVNAQKAKILKMHSISHYDKARRATTINFYQ